MPTGVYPRTSEACRRQALLQSQRLRGKAPWNKGLRGVQSAWNRGLTKRTDERVARLTEKILPSLNKHRPAGWNRGLTKETDIRVAKYAESYRRHIADCEGCGNPACGGNSYPSKLAWRAYDLFLQDFEIVIAEERFGTYKVDFLLAEEWIGIEVDGPFHDSDYDAKRDAWLLANHDLPIARLSQQDVITAARAAVEKAA